MEVVMKLREQDQKRDKIMNKQLKKSRETKKGGVDTKRVEGEDDLE